MYKSFIIMNIFLYFTILFSSQFEKISEFDNATYLNPKWSQGDKYLTIEELDYAGIKLSISKLIIFENVCSFKDPKYNFFKKKSKKNKFKKKVKGREKNLGFIDTEDDGIILFVNFSTDYHTHIIELEAPEPEDNKCLERCVNFPTECFHEDIYINKFPYQGYNISPFINSNHSIYFSYERESFSIFYTDNEDIFDGTIIKIDDEFSLPIQSISALEDDSKILAVGYDMTKYEIKQILNPQSDYQISQIDIKSDSLYFSEILLDSKSSNRFCLIGSTEKLQNIDKCKFLIFEDDTLIAEQDAYKHKEETFIYDYPQFQWVNDKLYFINHSSEEKQHQKLFYWSNGEIFDSNLGLDRIRNFRFSYSGNLLAITTWDNTFYIYKLK
jgi:hypothetical protein